MLRHVTIEKPPQPANDPWAVLISELAKHATQQHLANLAKARELQAGERAA